MLNKTVMMLKNNLPRMWSADHWKLYQLYQPSTVQNKSWLSIWEWPSQYSIDVNQLTEEDYNKATLKKWSTKLYQIWQAYAQKQIDDSGW
jgi:hypothetical protein